MTDADAPADTAAAAEPLPVSAPVPCNWPERLERAVAAWLAEEIHNSPVARVTDAYNHLVTTLDGLKARILQEI
ncbi:hypothetical protein FBZ89_10669 [Nitrospirillum amazonense]|uniref:Uncharacterized protein n=1 Tax=Nitrospirillum amazonense TaxID=28077 RepID=A0A560FGD7_9PROT|nr:hypothetical protein [Nitrospirillum amazonense]TWB20670.1 hypothetical protein FBZ89_10669 [Nitrospirillum amazonense]